MSIPAFTAVPPVVLASTAALSQEAVTVLGVVAIAILIALSAFFASSEIAIFSLEDHRIGTLVAEEVPGASTLAGLKADPRRLLVTILVGNNIANIAMSSIATGLLGFYFGPTEAVLVATFGVTSIVLLFGESAPKSYAVEHSESWALRIAAPLRLSQYVLYPLIVVFDLLTRIVNRAMGSEGNFETAYVSRSEIREVIDAGGREGILEDEEHRMLQRILRFRNRTAKETMVPRLDVVAVNGEETVAGAAERCVETGHRQLPVYEGTLDDVVGVVDAVDLLAARELDAPVRTLVTDPYVVPETKDVDEILTELRRGHRHMAVVVDEFGTTAGILTIEDIVEEIVGEILTETETTPIRWLDDDAALVRGEVNLHELNDRLGTDLPETSGFETIAGFVLDRTGSVPEEGEAIQDGDVGIIVETAEHNRILEVRVELPGGEGAVDRQEEAG